MHCPGSVKKKYKVFATSLQWVVLVVVEGVRGGGVVFAIGEGGALPRQCEEQVPADE